MDDAIIGEKLQSTGNLESKIYPPLDGHRLEEKGERERGRGDQEMSYVKHDHERNNNRRVGAGHEPQQVCRRGGVAHGERAVVRVDPREGEKAVQIPVLHDGVGHDGGQIVLHADAQHREDVGVLEAT